MKRFFILLASAALIFAGCAKELAPAAADGDQFTTEFTISTDAANTKAVADNDGFAADVDECLVQIWLDVDGTYKLYTKPEVKSVNNTNYTFSATFIKNQKYKILVWADKAGNYTFADDATITRNDLTVNNQDGLDAFYANVDIDAASAITNTTIIAKRPFAQLNVITTDLMKIPADFAPEYVSISYDAPASMNLLTEELGDDQTFTVTDSPAYYVGTTGRSLQSTLSMDYIFAPVEREIRNFSYSIKYTVPVERTFNNIPLQRNYRTNILGNLLAVDEDFEVVVDPIWNLEDDMTDIDIIAMVGDADTKCYTELHKAVEEAPTDGTLTTITLNKDYIGNGLVVAAGQNIAIDLGGHTFEVDTLVGSSNKTLGLQLLAGSDVVIKNGTIISYCDGLKNMIQNYANLTLQDVIIDASYAADCQYAVSNNSGIVNLLGTTSIYTATHTKAAAGAKAFDVCWAKGAGYPNGTQVTVRTSGTIEGDIEFDPWDSTAEGCLSTLDIYSGNFTGNFVINSALESVAPDCINIYGGTFAYSPAFELLAPGYAVKEESGKFVIAKADFVVDGIAYDSFDAAAAALGEGKTLTVSRSGNYVLPATLPANATIAGLEGKNVTFILSAALKVPAGFTFENVAFAAGSGLTSTDGALKVTADANFKGCIFALQSKYSVTVSGGTVNFTDCNWACNGKSRGIMVWGGTPVINVEGCTFDCTYPYNVDSGTPTTTFKNSTLNGWTSYGKGTVSFDGCEFGKSTSEYAFCRPYVSTTFTDCSFSEDYRVDFGAAGLTFTMNGCTQNGATVTPGIIEFDMQNGGTLVIDGTSYDIVKADKACSDAAALKAAIEAFNAKTDAGEFTIAIAPGTYEVADLVIYQNVKDKSLKVSAQAPGTVTMKLAAGSKSNAIFAIAGESNFSNPESVTIEGIKFDFSALTLSKVTSAVYFCAADESYLPAGTSHRYGHNLIMNNCEFIGEGTENSMMFAALQNTSPNHITINGCTVKNAGYITSGYGSDLVVKNTTTINCKAAINLQNIGLTVEDCTFNTYHDYCVRTNGGPVVVKNTTFNCDYSGSDATSGLIVLRGTESTEASVSGCSFTKASTAMNDVYCKTAWTVNGESKAASTAINF